jgi:hypothetical protein
MGNCRLQHICPVPALKVGLMTAVCSTLMHISRDDSDDDGDEGLLPPVKHVLHRWWN